MFRYSDPQRQVGQNYLHMLCTDLNKRHAKIANLLLICFKKLSCLMSILRIFIGRIITRHSSCPDGQHETLTLCCFNVGAASTTLKRHQLNASCLLIALTVKLELLIAGVADGACACDQLYCAHPTAMMADHNGALTLERKGNDQAEVGA